MELYRELDVACGKGRPSHFPPHLLLPVDLSQALEAERCAGVGTLLNWLIFPLKWGQWQSPYKVAGRVKCVNP